MALMRTFARVDSEGKITIPRNIRLALGLKKQDVVELKVIGAGKKNIVVSKRKNYR